MSFLPDTQSAVRTGIWLYGGTVRCRVVVIPADVFPGTGDHEDPPDVAEDREIACFAVWYEPPVAGYAWGGGGWYATLDEAVRRVEQVCPTIDWE